MPPVFARPAPPPTLLPPAPPVFARPPPPPAFAPPGPPVPVTPPAAAIPPAPPEPDEPPRLAAPPSPEPVSIPESSDGTCIPRLAHATELATSQSANARRPPGGRARSTSLHRAAGVDLEARLRALSGHPIALGRRRSGDGPNTSSCRDFGPTAAQE